MTRFEDRLTDLLREATDGIDVSPGLSRAALVDARRAQRVTVVLGTGAGLVGTGVVAAGALALASPTHQKLVVAPVSAASASMTSPDPCKAPVAMPSASPTTSAAPTTADAAKRAAAGNHVVHDIPSGPKVGSASGAPTTAGNVVHHMSTGATASEPPTGADAKDPAAQNGLGKPLPGTPPKPAGLDAISLPNPAPGFPLRRSDSDTSFVQSGADATGNLEWTRFFAVETSAPTTTPLPCGGVETGPTGPEATLMVMPNAQVVGADAQHVEGSFPTDGTTTALGRTAYVTHDGKGSDGSATVVEVSNDAWTVIATGDAGTTLPQLVALINAIDGI